MSIVREGPEGSTRGALALQAGLIEVLLDGVDLRRIRYRGLEVAQQVFVAVRSVGWDTVPGRVEHLTVSVEDRSFEVRFSSRHELAGEVLDWRGTISGGPSDELHYDMDASSSTGFRYARVGLNVVQGSESWRRRQLRASRAGALIHQDELPDLVGPQTLLDGREMGLFPPFDRLELTPVEGVTVDMSFAGDDFEMEDQRNYGDGSFKSYSTPLQRPGPFVLAAGGSLRQSVTVRVVDTRREATVLAPRGRGSVVAPAEGLLTASLRVGGTVAGRLPPLGLQHPAGAAVPTGPALARLAELRPDHIRVELMTEVGDVMHIAGARRLAATLGVPAIVELRASSEGIDVEATLRALLEHPEGDDAGASEMRHVLIDVPGMDPIDEGSTRSLLERARSLIDAAGGSTTAGVARDFLAEVLRAPIDPQVAGIVSFALSPAVHRSDERTLMENLAGISEEVRSARAHVGDATLLVGPVSLATRHGPYPDGSVRLDGAPAAADPREAGLFGAAWLVGCVAELARADPDAVTIATTIGPTGVVDATGSVASAVVSPAWHFLADLAGLSGAEVMDVQAGDECTALAVRTDSFLTLWVASRQSRLTHVVIDGLEWPSAWMRLLDTAAFRSATHDPDAYRAGAVQLAIQDGRLRIALDGFAMARLDMGAPRAGNIH